MEANEAVVSSSPFQGEVPSLRGEGVIPLNKGGQGVVTSLLSAADNAPFDKGDSETQHIHSSLPVAVAGHPKLMVEEVLAMGANAGPEDPQEKFICDSCQ